GGGGRRRAGGRATGRAVGGGGGGGSGRFPAARWSTGTSSSMVSASRGGFGGDFDAAGAAAWAVAAGGFGRTAVWVGRVPEPGFGPLPCPGRSCVPEPDFGP